MRKLIYLSLAILNSFWLSFSLFEFDKPFFVGEKKNSRPIALKNVRVFDGREIIPKTNVIIISDRIQALGKELAIPSEAEIIDGQGKTLLPGLIDSHVHVVTPQALEQALIFGVTTVIDMFMDVGLMKEVKKKQKAGQAQNLAYLVSAGTLATAPGGHGTQYGLKIPTLTNPDEAAAFVEARIADSSDFIKIIYDSGEVYLRPTPTLNLATIEALIKEAHKHGKLAIVHAATLKNCLDVLNLGADGLAHIYFDDSYDSNFGSLMANKKAFIISTLTVLENLSGISDPQFLIDDPALSPFLTVADIRSLKSKIPVDIPQERRKKLSETRRRVIQQLKENKVPILAGTDVPNPGTAMGASLHHELELLVWAGLTPVEALKAATSLPAEKFGLKDRGWIKPGGLADLVLVDGHPDEDIKATRRIIAVWKEGVKVEREKYQQKVIQEKERLNQLKSIPKPSAGSGLISDFEGEKISAYFGAGWSVSTDQIVGGKSMAQMELVKEGAGGSRQSLRVSGEIVTNGTLLWAGVMFFPGAARMAPANLSSFKGISFWLKGNERPYALVVFAQHTGFNPAFSRLFVAGPDWKEFFFSFQDMGLEPYDIMGIFIGAYHEPGRFWFQLDNVLLK
ncbi:MAG: CIA30 family protein [Candidatus Aminicenantes bacterium]|nr:CIA30 family protein [Candidatus Aminicenantes bacterium]